MFTLMIGFSAAGIAAGVGARVVHSMQRRQRTRQALGMPIPADAMSQSAKNLRDLRDLREFAAI